MIRSFVAGVLLTLIPLTVHAQTSTWFVPAIPTSVFITWDADAGVQPTHYRLIVGPDVIMVPTTKTLPCVACEGAAVTLRTLGMHTISVRSLVYAADGTLTAEGPVATATYDVRQTLALMPVTNIRLVMPVLEIPPAASFVDATGAIWTLGPQLPAASCPGVTDVAKCRSLQQGGVERGRGDALLLKESVVYGRGYEGDWYRWSGSAFQRLGPTKP